MLDGGAGADTMTAASATTPTSSTMPATGRPSALGDGTDTVQCSVSFTLGANVENLTLTGSAAINGTGNALPTSSPATAATTSLDGGAGADTMTGGLGNDTYVVDNAGDVVDRGRRRAPTRSQRRSPSRSAPMSRT